MLLISIPKPCHENWNEMSPQDKGRFCQVCSKTVVDFTLLNDDEVKNYFLQQVGQKTCGRFRSDQLTNTDNLLPRLLQTSIPFWKKFLAIVLILFGSLLSACNQSTISKPKLEIDGERERKLTMTEVTLGGIEVDSSFIPDQLGTPSVIQCSTTIDTTLPVIVGEIMEEAPVIIEDSVCEGPADINCVLRPIETRPDSAKQMFDQHGRPVSNPLIVEDISCYPPPHVDSTANKILYKDSLEVRNPNAKRRH